MKKVVMEVEEVLKYSREVVLYVPDDVNEDEFDQAVTQLERMGDLSASDISLVLARRFPGITESNDGDRLDDLSSPRSVEIEIESLDFDVKE